MAHQFKIVVENEGKEAPDAYLKMMIEKYPSSFGCASVDANGQLVVYRQAEGASMALLQEIKEKYGASKRYSVFGKSDGSMPEECVQPYSVQQIAAAEGSDPEDVVVSFWDGEFSQCFKKDSALATAYFANEETLYPLFQLLGETIGDAENKLELLIENLDNESVVEEVTNLLSTSTSGAVLVLGTNVTPGTKGSVLLRTIGDTEKEYPWGWVSDHLGYTEEERDLSTTGVAEKPKKVLVLKGKTNVTKAEGGPDKKEAEPKPGGDKTPAKEAEPGEGFEFVTPPGDLRGRELENWYKARTPNGQLPRDWMARKAIRVKKAAGSKMATSLEGMKRVAQASPTEKKDSLPVISEAEMKAYENEFVKGRFRDSTGKSVPNPFTFKDFESKLPRFTEAMAGHGIKSIADVYSWPPISLQFLVEKCPMLSVNLLMQLIETASNQAAELASYKPKEEPKTVPTSGRKILTVNRKAG